MQILNIVNTTFELYYLSAVGYLLKLAHPETGLRLLATQKTISKLNPDLASLYDDIQLFKPVQMTVRRPWVDLIGTLRFRRQIEHLDLHADIICISSFREYFANILCRQLGNNSRIVAFRMCDYECDNLSQKKNRLYQAYLNAFNSQFGFSTMEYRFHSDPATMAATSWYRHSPYHRTICISDWKNGQDGSRFRLPPPFIALKQLYKLPLTTEFEDKKPILVAGERTPLYPCWGDSDQDLYKGIFNFIRENFKENDLLFKPRPGLTNIENLPLEGFHLVPGEIPFEELCLRNQYSRVISIKSTSSKLAAFCGHPAYLLYPMFNFPQNIREILDTYLSDMKAIINVQNFNDLLQVPSSSFNPDLDALSQQYWKAVVD